MERPQYANAFSVSYNANAEEVAITFIQEYPGVDVNKMASPDGHMEPIATIREEVASIAVPRSVADIFIRALGDVLKSNPE